MTDLSITVSQVQPGTGSDAQFEQGVAGASITAGQALYLDASTNTYKLADNDLSAAAATVRGVALHAASSGQPIRLQTAGSMTLGAGAAPVTSTIYIASATAGGICPAADLASTNRTSIIGVGGASNTLIVKIHNSGQVKA